MSPGVGRCGTVGNAEVLSDPDARGCDAAEGCDLEAMACVIAEGANDDSESEGVCVDQDSVSFDEDEDPPPPLEIVFGAAAVVATLATITGGALAAWAGSDFALGEVLTMAQVTAYGGQLVLPQSAPGEYVEFATSLFWTNLAVLPLGDSAELDALRAGRALSSGAAASSGSSRLLQDSEGTRQPVVLEGLSRFAVAANIVPRFLLLSCVLVVLLIMLAYGAACVLLWRRELRDVAVEAPVRVLYYCIYPLSTFTAFACYLVFVSTDERLRGSSADVAWQSLLALAVAATLALWAWAGFHGVRRSSGSDSDEPSHDPGRFRALLNDWRPGAQMFWGVRAANNIIKGLFIGIVVDPQPIQAVSFFVAALLYLSLLLYVRPYKFDLVNRMAIAVAAVYLLSTLLPIVFSQSPAPASPGVTATLGKVQIGLSLVCLLGLLLLVVAQVVARKLDAHKQEPKAGTPETPEKQKRPAPMPAQKPVSPDSDSEPPQPTAKPWKDIVREAQTEAQAEAKAKAKASHEATVPSGSESTTKVPSAGAESADDKLPQASFVVNVDNDDEAQGEAKNLTIV